MLHFARFKASPSAKLSFIHTQIVTHLHVNKTNFHTKGFALGLALKQRRKVIRKSPISLAFKWLIVLRSAIKTRDQTHRDLKNAFAAS